MCCRLTENMLFCLQQEKIVTTRHKHAQAEEARIRRQAHWGTLFVLNYP